MYKNNTKKTIHIKVDGDFQSIKPGDQFEEPKVYIDSDGLDFVGKSKKEISLDFNNDGVVDQKDLETTKGRSHIASTLAKGSSKKKKSKKGKK